MSAVEDTLAVAYRIADREVQSNRVSPLELSQLGATIKLSIESVAAGVSPAEAAAFLERSPPSFGTSVLQHAYRIAHGAVVSVLS